jgi:hypothetical protein
MLSRLSRFWSYVEQHSVWSGLIVLLLFAMVSAAFALLRDSGSDSPPLPIAGWGPPRPAYWCKEPRFCDGADHVVFNSYANAPNYGEERAFVDAKPAAYRVADGFQDVLDVDPGETVLIRLYVNNAAWADRLGDRSGVAVGTEARAEIPFEADTQHNVMGFISATNALPRVIWDGVTLRSNQPTTLHFVFDSARWWTRPFTHGLPISDALMEEGTPIGSWALDGRFGDSFRDSGLLTFRVRVTGA